MIVLTIKDNALVAFRNEENGYVLEQNEQAATVNGTVLELPTGITHIGNTSDNQINGFYRYNTPDHDDLGLSEDAVLDMKSITSIKLPDSVTTIKCNFFNYFPNLKHIVFPSNSQIETIYPWAFADCPNLEEIEIPANMKGKKVDIKVDAFVNCPELTKISLPQNSVITLYPAESFYGCGKLSDLELYGEAMEYMPNSKDRKNDILVGGMGLSANVKPLTELNDDFILVQKSTKRLVLPRNVKSLGGTENFQNLEYIRANDELESIESESIDFSVTKIESDNIKNGVWYNKDNVLLRVFNEQEAIQDGKFIIPDGIVRISNEAFRDCDNIVTIKIPSSVTSIGELAFCCCYDLENIEIPDSVTSIGDNAFSNCYKLKTIRIPDSVTRIGDWTFDGCGRLTDITMPNGTISIGRGTFRECRGLKSVTIPNSIKSIGDEAFESCNELTSIVIPGSVTSIGTDAFAGCYKLADISVDESNEYFCVRDGILYSKDMKNLYLCPRAKYFPDNIVIPDSVTSIGDGVFAFCEGITSITLPKGITSITKELFVGCKGLTSITIPNSVTSIDNFAFAYCESLTSISLPRSIKSISDVAFEGCDKLADISVDESSEYFCVMDGIVYSKDMKNLYLCPRAKYFPEKFKIPEGVTSICNGAFSHCSMLTSIIIPGSIANIENDAFTCCSGLKDVIMQDGVINIGEYAFKNCSALTHIKISKDVKIIGKGLFLGCSELPNITIPDGVTRIDEEAFASCRKLTDITIPKGVRYIGEYAFANCSSITSINIPDSVTQIGEYALYGISNDETPRELTFICSNDARIRNMIKDNIEQTEGNIVIKFIEPAQIIVPDTTPLETDINGNNGSDGVDAWSLLWQNFLSGKSTQAAREQLQADMQEYTNAQQQGNAKVDVQIVGDEHVEAKTLQDRPIEDVRFSYEDISNRWAFGEIWYKSLPHDTAQAKVESDVIEYLVEQYVEHGYPESDALSKAQSDIKNFKIEKARRAKDSLIEKYKKEGFTENEAIKKAEDEFSNLQSSDNPDPDDIDR